MTWTKAKSDTLMERVLAPANLKRAYHRVVSNKGAPGADGMTVAELAGYVKTVLANPQGEVAGRRVSPTRCARR